MRSVLGQILVISIFLVPDAAGAAAGHLAQSQADAAKPQDVLPYRDVATPEEVQKNFRPQKFTPLGNNKYYFEILVPNGWQSQLSDVDPDQVAQDKTAPVQVADFGPGGGVDDVGVQVSYMRVPEQTSLETFMNDYIKNSGGEPLARQKAEFQGHPVEDALLRLNNPDIGPMLTRATAIRHGDLVFVVTGGAAEEKYERYKRTFGAVALTFQPLGK